MSFTFNCPHCHQKVEAEDEWIGQQADCPACGKTITIQKSQLKTSPQIKLTPIAPPPPTPKKIATLDNDSSKTTESESSVNEDLQVYCPRCKCTQISTIEERHTDLLRCLLWGIFALGFKNRVLYNVCKKCGYKWELKQSLSKEEENQQNSTNATIFLVGIVIIAIIFIIVYKAYS